LFRSALAIVASGKWRRFWLALAVLIVVDMIAEYQLATPDHRRIGTALAIVFVVRGLGTLWMFVIGTRLAVPSRPPLRVDRGLLFAAVYEVVISGAFTLGADVALKHSGLGSNRIGDVSTLAELLAFAPLAPWLTNLYATAQLRLGVAPHWRRWLPALLLALSGTVFPLTLAHGALTDLGVAAHGIRAAAIGLIDGLLSTLLVGWQIALSSAAYLRVVGSAPAR